MKNRPPIIIVGMHRSGTTMVTRLLIKLGYFAGAQREENSEALFFLRLNEWIMAQCGGAWDHPEPIDDLLADKEARTLAINYFGAALNSRQTISYMGLLNFLRFRKPSKIELAWGWKDPRNTYTLPLWLDLFPDARVIHVIRHGVDVAQSLHTRSCRNLNLLAKSNSPKLRLPNTKSCIRNKITDSVRCLSLEGSFSLWNEYTQRAKLHTASLGGHATEVRFEELLNEPEACIRNLAEFCGLGVTAEAMQECRDEIKSGRAFAYRQDEYLSKFADSCEQYLKPFGY